MVTEKRPGVGSFPGRALGAAWASRRGMSREEAMVCCSDALIGLLTDAWIITDGVYRYCTQGEILNDPFGHPTHSS